MLARRFLSQQTLQLISSSADTRQLSPARKDAVAKQSLMNCPEMASTNPEQVLKGPVDRKESLNLLDGLEPSHLPLLLSRGLVRNLSPVVFILSDSMLN